MLGATVTQRVKATKQPYGGFLKPSSFERVQLQDENSLFPVENVSPSLVGLTVDYLTRYMTDDPRSAIDAFDISLRGAYLADEEVQAKEMINGISGLGDRSITLAVKLTAYDVCYRAGLEGFVPPQQINPDAQTCENIRIMVNRSIRFLEKYGPKTKDEFTFEGGYTKTIVNGDGDFLTRDTLWDFKVSKKPPTKDHTLQILIYWLMGLHSIHPEFQTIEYLGIYNPRLNTVWRLDVTQIPKETIDFVSTEVIGYWDQPENN
ncbi:hypothetical protein JS541_10085 [Bifidobacterium sp. SO1]|nr:hypothetical protein [Bifidobacterium sp. SO1]